MAAEILLPGRASPLVIPSPGWADRYPPPRCRRVFAAAHVAARPAASGSVAGAASGSVAGAASGSVVDWEGTMRFRDHLWAHGFGVAEAMDTAQRGMGLSWDQARELIARSSERAVACQGALACGVGTDQLRDGGSYRLGEIIGAYAEQMAFVQSAGASVILMASRALAASARGARDYLEVYGELLRQADRPVILHWLGVAFDPALRGYWGSTDFDAAADTVLSLIERAGGKVDGIKLSVLDAGREAALRRRLPAGVRLYTGDDFHYAELIRGDADGRHSDALLGAFAAITAPAAAALAALDRGDLAGYDAAMAPTVPLSRRIFEPPTFNYKVGVAFLAWLNGLQLFFSMLGGLERRRPAEHLVRVFELAAAAGALTDPDLAVGRMGRLLAEVAGSFPRMSAGAGVGGPPSTQEGSRGARDTVRPGAGARPVGLERLSLNQVTVKHLGLREAVALCGRHGIPAIGLWRDRVAEVGVTSAAAAVRAGGLHVSSLCRGGFFTGTDRDERRAALADNRAAIAEAAELGADALVLVCGGLAPGLRDLGLARRMVADAIGELVPVAQRMGVRLGIEALHPMFCADRCVISSLGEAVDLALRFPADAVGVVVDTYHVWWDARLAAEIARAAGRIVSYQVCDWVLPLPADTLLGRGHLGDGVIDFGPITASVAAAGYRGYVEVEIFNASVWQAPADQTAATVRERFAAVLGGAP